MVDTTTLARVCACSLYSYLVPQHTGPNGDQVWRRVTTECLATTRSTFSPGHDMKLRSLLVEAGAEGHQVLWTGDDTVIGKTAERWAADLGWLDAVRDGIKRAR